MSQKVTDGAQDNQPRCPLGFTGTPPIGHPSVAGFTSKTTENTNSLISSLKSYQPSTLLIVDAIFLGLCVILAIYRDDVKAILNKFFSSKQSIQQTKQ